MNFPCSRRDSVELCSPVEITFCCEQHVVSRKEIRGNNMCHPGTWLSELFRSAPPETVAAPHSFCNPRIGSILSLRCVAVCEVVKKHLMSTPVGSCGPCTRVPVNVFHHSESPLVRYFCKNVLLRVGYKIAHVVTS